MNTDHRLAPLRRLAIGWCLLPAMAWSAEPAAATAPGAAADPIVRLGTGVAVDTGRREAYLEATVCLRRGILEYLICRKNTFEHEAVFATEAAPSSLHTALLLIAAEPYAYSPGEDWPLAVREHRAAFVDIEVEFAVGGTTHRRRLGAFARNRERPDGAVSDRWAFTGSFFHLRDGQEHYAADSAGGVIGLTAKGAAVVQYAEPSGIPYQGDDQGLECDADAIPPIGTAVRVIFRVHDATAAKRPDPRP
jgi:hypothetical protein